MWITIPLLYVALVLIFVLVGWWVHQSALVDGVGLPLLSAGAAIFLGVYGRDVARGPWLRCDLERRSAEFPRNQLSVAYQDIEAWRVTLGDTAGEQVSELSAVVRCEGGLQVVPLVGAVSDGVLHVAKALERATGIRCETGYDPQRR